MHLSLSRPAYLFFHALDLGVRVRPAEWLERWQARAIARRAEEAVASLPAHVLVDLGLVAADEKPSTATDPSLAATPMLPPTSAMHRRGDYGALGQLSSSEATACWTWPVGR